MKNEPSGNKNAARPDPALPAPLPASLLIFLLLLAVLAPNLARAASCASARLPPNRAVLGQALLRDASGRLSLEEVVSPARAADFVPLPRQLAGGYTHDVLWLRFCLPIGKGGEKPHWLRIAPPMLDQLTLYLPRGGGYEAQRAGDHYPFTERAWKYRLFALPIPPDLDTSRPAYLRIDTSSSLNLRLDLWPEEEFQGLVVRDSMFYGVLSGTILLLIGFSLLSWLWLNDRLYLFYAFNALAEGILLLMNAGFGSQFLYPGSAAANDHMIAWLTGPILAVHVLFFTYLFAIRRHLPKLYPFMLGLATAYALLAPLSLLVDWRSIGVVLQLLPIPIGIMWMLAVFYVGWKDRSRRLYILAFSPWLIGLLASAMLRLGRISEYFLINYSAELSALIHLVLLPVLIIHRARRAEQEKDRALARELVEAHRVERELEARVGQRTAALQQEIRVRGLLQEKLREALEVEQAVLANQRQLVAMLSHEFRTPLATIDATAQNLGMMVERSQPQLAPRVGKIQRAVGRLLSLLENCLANERLNDSGAELRQEELDVRAYLIDHYAEQSPAGAQRIRLELPDAPVPVRCDRHLFGVALSNLVTNALKYSPEDRPVNIRLAAGDRNGMVAIEVGDQGPGIRPEDRERIFDRFFRSQGRPLVAGAGLGLHLARVLARRHGGDVVLAPERPGHGAVFILTLPERGACPQPERMLPA